MRHRATIFLLCLGVFFAFPRPSSTQWTKTGEIKAKWITSLAVSGTHIFASTGQGGIFMSTDNGATWAAVNEGLPGNAVFWCLAVSGPHLFAGSKGYGIFLSTDNGASWQAANEGLPENPSVLSLQTSGTSLFAAVRHDDQSTVYRSSDNGANWKPANTGLPNANMMCFAACGSNLFAATYGQGVYMSTNNGDNWKPVNKGFPKDVCVLCLAAAQTSLFAGTEMDGIFLSTNNGSQWKAVNSGVPETEIHCLLVSGARVFAGTGGGHDALMSGGDVKHIYHGAGVLVSSDNGAHWNAIKSGLRPAPDIPLLKGRVAFWVECLAVCGSYLFAGTQEGEIWRVPLSEDALRAAQMADVGRRTAQDLESQIAAFEHAVQKDPNDAEGWYQLGLCYEKAGRKEESAAAFNKARNLKPELFKK
jgi:photosystem II stability/assembly factor-like uncharacterized protein